jgi:polyadenylate-binding protein
MDKYDLSSDGNGAEGLLTVLEYQGKKGALTITKHTFNNVYVKGFPKDDVFSEENLSELFRQFGEIQNAAIMRDGQGISKGFGFVCFSDPSSAEKATQYVHNIQRMEQQPSGENPDIELKLINGVKLTDLYIKEAKKKTQREKELQMNNFKYKKSIMYFSLFVKNFPVGTTEEELKIYFSTACQGEVTRIQVVEGSQQAFVNFEK